MSMPASTVHQQVSTLLQHNTSSAADSSNTPAAHVKHVQLGTLVYINCMSPRAACHVDQYSSHTIVLHVSPHLLLAAFSQTQHA